MTRARCKKLDAAPPSDDRWNESMSSTSSRGLMVATHLACCMRNASKGQIHRVMLWAQRVIDWALELSSVYKRCCLPACKVLPNAELVRSKKELVLELKLLAARY
jgi:hypothetical protein